MRGFRWGAVVGLIALCALLITYRAAGLPAAFLVAAALTLSVVIALIWGSLNYLSGDASMTFDDAMTLAAPTAAEEQKRAVLRALRDLEYERSVGKISPEDFKIVDAHYRAEAKRLIAVADETLASARARASELLDKEVLEAEAKRAKTEGDKSSAEEPST